MKRGAGIKDGISHWDADVRTLARPTCTGAFTIFSGTSRTGSLARCYMSKQAAKAPAPLVVGNEDIIVSTLQKAVWFGSTQRRRNKRLRHCFVAMKDLAARMEGTGGTASSTC